MSTCIRCHKEMDDTPFCPHCGARQQRSNKHRKRGNGLGTAFKRPGQNTWTARVTLGYVQGEDGRRIQKYRAKGGFRTQTAALEYCARLHQEQSVPKKAPLLQHYWDLYVNGKMKKLSDSKYTAYEIAWKRCRRLHLTPVDKITLADIQSVIDQETSTHYPAKDIRTLLTNLFKLAAGEGYVDKDLPKLAEIPSLEEVEGVPFNAEEQAALWRTYENGCQFAAIPLIMIYTGIMPGEIMRMRVEMINFDSMTIHGLGIKTRVRKKSVVVIPDFIVPLLQEACGDRTTGIVFRINRDNFYKKFRETLALAGCRNLPPYSCRHTTATALAIDQNVAPQTLQKAMRWSSTRMASKYVHPSTGDVRDALSAMKKRP